MSTPLAATYRIEQLIDVDGLFHKCRIYLGVTPSGDTTGFDVVDRLAAGGIGLSQAIDAWLTVLAPFYNPGNVAFGQTLLQNFVGTAWLPVVAYQSAVTPTSAAPVTHGIQMCMSMRDNAFHKVRNIIFEGIFSSPLKTTNPTGFGGIFTTYTQAFTTATIPATHLPWLWARGRSNRYIGSFVSLVMADNDKIRRARGLA